MRINLLPEEDRASLSTVQMGTVLFIVSIVLIALLAFSSVYLYWQVVTEREQLRSYQDTVETLAYYRKQVNDIKNGMRQIEELLKPLAEHLERNQPAMDISLLLNRVATSAQTSSAWLQSLSVTRDGSVPISGYAVNTAEITRFLKAVGQYPFHVVMGSTYWTEEDGIRLLEFDARITPIAGGDQP
jgi:hypothetical protein